MAWAAPRAPSGAAPSGPSAIQTRRREIKSNLKWQDFVQRGEQLELNHEVTELKGKRPEEQGGPSHYVQTVTSAGGVGSRFAIDKYWRLRIGGSHKAEHLYLKLNRFHCVLLFFFFFLASREQLIILPKKMKTAYLVFHLRLLQTKIEMVLMYFPRLDGEVLVTSLMSDFWSNCVFGTNHLKDGVFSSYCWDPCQKKSTGSSQFGYFAYMYNYMYNPENISHTKYAPNVIKHSGQDFSNISEPWTMNPEDTTAPPKETKHPSCTIGMSYSNGTKKSLVSLFKSHILAEDDYLFQLYLCHWLWSLEIFFFYILPKGNLAALCRISTFCFRMVVMWKSQACWNFVKNKIVHDGAGCEIYIHIFLAWRKTLAGFQTCYATMSRSTNASEISPGKPKEYFHLTWWV